MSDITMSLRITVPGDPPRKRLNSFSGMAVSMLVQVPRELRSAAARALPWRPAAFVAAVHRR
jgi:hypothetical protein